MDKSAGQGCGSAVLLTLDAIAPGEVTPVLAISGRNPGDMRRSHRSTLQVAISRSAVENLTGGSPPINAAGYVDKTRTVWLPRVSVANVSLRLAR